MPSMLTVDAPAVTSQNNTQIGQILIVEDEELIRETIALTLREEGYEVLTAADGRRGLDIVHTISQSNS